MGEYNNSDSGKIHRQQMNEVGMIKPVNRREFLASSSAGVAAAASPLAALRAIEKTPRNVILIISDTLRRDALGCYGGRWVQTPFLDEFACSAVRFQNAWLCSFPTVPTRHDILSGQFTFTFKPWSPLEKDTLTLQDVLRGSGVYTALIADTPHPFRPDYNYQRNFDHVVVHRGQENDEFRKDPVPVKLPCDPRKLRGGEKVVTQYLRNVTDRKVEEDYFCARTMRAAADWLDKSYHRQPFFLYVDTFDPHEPWDPPRSYVDKYDPGYRGDEVIYPRYDRWHDFLSEAELRHCRALYSGEASMVDRWIGHLLQKITLLGLLDNTLVMIVADHGFYLGEHGYIGKSFIRDNKFQSLPLYSEVSRIPFLVHYPGCRQNSTIAALAQTVNIPATVLDFLRVQAPASFEAPSLWPVLAGEKDRVTEVVIASPTLSHANVQRPRPTDRATITDGRWMLIWGASGRGAEGEKTRSVDSQERILAPLTGEAIVAELYDLETDPGCTRNVAAANPGRVQDLHRRFSHFLEHSRMRRDHLSYFSKL
jgi:arylsulfatase A-like enzyme